MNKNFLKDFTATNLSANILKDKNTHSNENLKYKNKYNKYKTKYLKLKQKYEKQNNVVNIDADTNTNTNSDNDTNSDSNTKDYFDELKKLYPKCVNNGNESKSSTETYGEMEYTGIELLNSKFNSNNRIKYFIDIGSGRGKLICWFAGIPNIIKSIGIEIVEQRYKDSLNLKNKLSNYPDITKKIELICDDVSKINLNNLVNLNSSDTLIWISNLCFGQELSDKIFTQILNQMDIGCIIICSRKPFIDKDNHSVNNKYLNLLDELKIPMSWTNLSNVFVFQIKTQS